MMHTKKFLQNLSFKKGIRHNVSNPFSMRNLTKPTQTIEELTTQNEQLTQEIESLQAKINWLEEQFRLSQQRKFGVSSEKSHPDQIELQLFNEAEVTADESVAEPTVETITYKRKKRVGQRDEMLKNLPTETIHYHLPVEDQACLCCGEKVHEMSKEIRRELKIIPAEVKVVEHVQHIYSCRSCEREGIETPIVKAKMPTPMYPKSLASPSAVSYIIQQKYVEGIPLYRQEKQFERLGVSLSRQTMANWIIHVAKEKLTPIYEQMRLALLKETRLHADETTLQVLNEPGRRAESKSYLWQYRTGHGLPPIILFDYQQTRASKHPKVFLKDFNGYLHTDGYAGYNGLPNVTLVGCWAHARRQFVDAIKALPSKTPNTSTLTIAEEGLQFCNELFRIEKALKEKGPEERKEERLEKSQPVLDAFYAWLKKTRPQVTPKSATGKAINYCLNQWPKLINFMIDGNLEIDNNRAERSFRPFVIGRKNWIFATSMKGAKSSAIIYSIIETAKENNLNPFQYLTYLLEQLSWVNIDDPVAIEQLLPWSTTLPDHCRVPKKN